MSSTTHRRTEILMPALAAGMEEGKIARWLKEPGDAVTTGEIIVEIESDKAVMELPCESAGVLHVILAQIGETVSVGGVIGELLVENEADGSGLRARGHGETPASPLARQLAAASGVSLANLKGSGPGGRIVRVDVERAQNELATPQQVATNPAAVPAAWHELPHSATRKTIARRLADSKASIPHFYLSADCELDSLLEMRARLNAQGEADKLSINDFVIKAAARALRAVPEVNVSWSDDCMRVYEDIDVAVAVSTEGGLITPIVRRADSKSLQAISREVRQLTARARDNKLQPSEYQGGGLTISNLGMFGVQSFAAIINPPQSCILAVGTATRRPVVRGDACVPATVMSCTLSFDHRSVDGVLGARYLASFKALLDHPEQLVIEPPCAQEAL